MRRLVAKRGKVLGKRELRALVCCIKTRLAYIPATEMAARAVKIQDFKE
jgi:hypothetical protein